MKYDIAISLFILFFLKDCFSSDFEYVPPNFLVELEKKHEEIIGELPQSFEKKYISLYPNFKILNYCSGSFRTEGADEYVLTIVNPVTLESGYIVLLKNKDKSFTNLVLFGLEEKNKKIPQGKGKRYDSPVNLGVQCHSAMGIKRLNNTIKDSEGITGSIAPVNGLDSLCILQSSTPPVHNHNACYSYDEAKKKFVYIGGWTT